ncbi:MAG: DUF302 domain-containing protein [Bryobacterales bacterium]|jgi:uncharacterized protein (DUF302 family)|nr:DUF302 domain-containing protein [Bryobacterales bacterium]
MLYEIPSEKSLEAIGKGLQEAAARHGFGVIAVHNLKETMANKGVEFNGECLVYEVCNPFQAKKVLEANGAVSTALPCRISVYLSPHGYKLATILPTALMKHFATPSLLPVAREVEEVIVAMMREAA